MNILRLVRDVMNQLSWGGSPASRNSTLPAPHDELAAATELAVAGEHQRSAEIFRSLLDAEPDNQDFQNNLAYQLMYMGVFGPAEKTFRELLQSNPTHLSGWQGLLQLLTAAGKWEEAKDAAMAATDTLGRHDWIDAGLARALLATGQLEKAVTLLRGTTEISSSYILVDAFERIGRTAEAAAVLHEILKTDANGSADTFVRLGRFERALGNNAEAEAAIRRAIDLDPSHPLAVASLGSILVESGKHQDAADFLEAATRTTPLTFDLLTVLCTSRAVSLACGKDGAAAAYGLEDIPDRDRVNIHSLSNVLSKVATDERLARELAEILIQPDLRRSLLAGLQDMFGRNNDPSGFWTRISGIGILWNMREDSAKLDPLPTQLSRTDDAAEQLAVFYDQMFTQTPTTEIPMALLPKLAEAKQQVWTQLNETIAAQKIAAPTEAIRQARRRHTPMFFLVSAPRSGSVYFFNTFSNGLGKLSRAAAMSGAFPNFVLHQKGFSTLLADNGSAHTHLAPSTFNLRELDALFPDGKFVVHIREPRQTLVSWLNFLPGVVGHRNSIQAKHYGLPEDYLELHRGTQLDWLIENWLPVIIDWTQGWVDAQSTTWFRPEILITHSEDLYADQEGFYNRVLDFYGIDHELFDYPPMAKPGRYNYRTAKREGWRALMSDAQVSRASAGVPQNLKEKFGWS